MATVGALALILGGVTIINLAVGMISSDGSSAIAEPDLAVIQFIPQLEGPHDLVQGQVSIPVLLPTEFPGIEDFWVTSAPINDPSKYEFSIDRSRDCKGSGFCTAGSFGGELITDETETLDERYAHLDVPNVRADVVDSAEPRGSVELAQGFQGEFIPWIGTAQCTEARVYWLEGIYRYYVGIECGSQARVVEFANSIINNTARQ